MTLLDSHALLWWVTEDRRLSTKARREIERSKRVLVSPASIYEIASLQRKGAIRFDRSVRDWFNQAFERHGVEVAPISSSIAIDAGLLGSNFPRDPIDRILYATARNLVVPFVTRDEPVRTFAQAQGDVRVIW